MTNTMITSSARAELDLRPLIDLRPEAEAMRARILAGEIPTEDEYRALQRRHEDLAGALRAQVEELLDLVDDAEDYERLQVLEGVETFACLLDGTGGVGVAWDEAHTEPETGAVLVAFLDKMRAEGAPMETLWRAYDRYADDLVDDDARHDVAGWLRSLEG